MFVLFHHLSYPLAPPLPLHNSKFLHSSLSITVPCPHYVSVCTYHRKHLAFGFWDWLISLSIILSNQLGHPSRDEWIKKHWCIYTMGYYSAIRKNKIMAFAGKWMELENIMLSEISQSQKTKGQMFTLISGCWHIMGWGGKGRYEKIWIGWREWEEARQKGVGKMVEWDRHHYPMYMYDCMNGVTLHCVQPDKWNVVLHLCTMSWNAFCCHV